MQEEARRLAEEAKRGQANIDTNEVEIRKERLYTAENVTNDLLKQAKKANETAHHAIINGTKAIALAEENLKVLEVGEYPAICKQLSMKRKFLLRNMRELLKLYYKFFYSFLLQCPVDEIFQFECFLLPANYVTHCIISCCLMLVICVLDE